ncbi:MAG: efflux RND transporter permease subunit, partial [Bacteroidia bacterium]|nr:efflux RND transporter permease subunit [Bacteroidia bacterium]
GEFIPSLEEGDFAVEMRMLPGTSLTETINTTLQAAEILQKKFPEVTKVIGKIGTAEVPTDPMPVEACDLMIILKDKSDWACNCTREELAQQMADALSVIPGVNFGFQQPIQMRFNELMTGTKQDVAVKIFGEDLDSLAGIAEKMGNLIRSVEGAEDIAIEQVTGLPQIIVRLNRERIARYHLTIEHVNQVLRMGFAGEIAGTVYEGEKRFGLVVRLHGTGRQSIEDVRRIYIPIGNGKQVPLEEVADINLETGPNQIQHESSRRRIIIGFNVRGRDVESVVQELRQKTQQLRLPEGYFLEYGGQFQNLVHAKSRLAIAVPIALALIAMLLYLTFGSIWQTALILTAIPFAAIGGIWALLIRGMPFSISAGVGFIALFGVAVLNGIVLIAEFNRLQKENVAPEERILKGTETRLRPVLLTASVASLGFLPMAISTGSGAEVQKPLATVVIGGLITSTILTLVVLPVLYFLLESHLPTTNDSNENQLD